MRPAQHLHLLLIVRRRLANHTRTQFCGFGINWAHKISCHGNMANVPCGSEKPTSYIYLQPWFYQPWKIWRRSVLGCWDNWYDRNSRNKKTKAEHMPVPPPAVCASCSRHGIMNVKWRIVYEQCELRANRIVKRVHRRCAMSQTATPS